jgi:hypothetical protein
MADLANAPGRRTATRRLTNNRSNILPARRDTDTPSLVVRADMRTAARGDGGADELRRVLGSFTDAAVGFEQSRIAGAAEGYREDAAEGALDAASGAGPDDDRSTAYQETYYRINAESRYNAFSTETLSMVDEALNNGADPGEIQELVMGRTTAFFDDLRDTVPNAGAQRETALRVAEMARGLDTSVSTRIRERTQEAAVTTAQGNIAAALQGDQPMDFEGYVTTFRGLNFTPTEAKAHAITGVLAVALDRDNPRPELLDALLGSKQADGATPSLSAAERVQVLDRITQARSLLENKEREEREERRDTLMDGWYTKVLDGDIVDDEVFQAGVRGDLEPGEVQQYLGLFNNLRDARTEGHENEDFILEVTRRAALGNPPSDAQVLEWERTGRFGTGRAGQKAAISFLGGQTALRNASRAGGGGEGGGGSGMSARTERTRNITTARGLLWRQLDRGEQGSAYQQEMVVSADREFNRLVRQGVDPLEASRRVITDFRPYIEGRIGATSRNLRLPAEPGAAPPPGNYDWTPR